VSEGDLRHLLVRYGRICYDRRLITSNDGNLSVRLGDSRFMITPAGICKGRMRSQDLLVIDTVGGIIDAGAIGAVSTETPMHLEVYRQRPDVNAVIHAHPVFATALTIAGIEFPTDLLPESVVLLGEVPTTTFAAPSSTEGADSIRGLIGRHSGLLLRQHGALACGPDLEAALNLLERIEFVAEVYHRASAMGRVDRLPVEEKRRLQQSRNGRAPR
jgi:L-fuculose-phosphate aldolase